MEAVIEFAREGGPVLGICNGFQVLCEAGLLPGALLPNEGLRFVCRQVDVEVVDADTPFTNTRDAGDRLSIPVKHTTGRYYLPPDEGAARGRTQSSCATRRATTPTAPSATSPAVANEAGNVFGLMPHPEHAVDALTGSTDGLASSSRWRASPPVPDTVALPGVDEAVALGLTAAEYELIVEKLGRAPNQVELAMFSLLWSEHCAYKHSRKLLRRLPTEGERVLMGPGENAGAVDVGGGLAVRLQGGVAQPPERGRALPGRGHRRRRHPARRLRGRRAADRRARLAALRRARRPSGPRYLLDRAVAGIGHYGNSIGVPTVGGEVYFEAPYEPTAWSTRCASAWPSTTRLIRSAAAGPGNVVVLMGASTGRDGIGGASVLASAELDEERRGQAALASRSATRSRRAS